MVACFDFAMPLCIFHTLVEKIAVLVLFCLKHGRSKSDRSWRATVPPSITLPVTMRSLSVMWICGSLASERSYVTHSCGWSSSNRIAWWIRIPFTPILSFQCSRNRLRKPLSQCVLVRLWRNFISAYRGFLWFQPMSYNTFWRARA